MQVLIVDDSADAATSLQMLLELEDIAAQGFVRVRIDGRVHELEALPKLDPKRKHSIEAVVDRFRVKLDSGQRLAESFETALRVSGGLAECRL